MVKFFFFKEGQDRAGGVVHKRGARGLSGRPLLALAEVYLKEVQVSLSGWHPGSPRPGRRNELEQPAGGISGFPDEKRSRSLGCSQVRLLRHGSTRP